MAKKTNSKTLKVGFPKYSDIRDIVSQFTIVDSDMESIKAMFRFSLPEIGRQIAKNNGYNTSTLVKASGIASSIVTKMEDVSLVYSDLRQFIATELGFAEQTWQIKNSQCYQRLDLEDLYNNHNLEVELHVVVTRKTISREDALKKYGVK